MSHLDEGTIHALLDGEVPATQAAAFERHLSGCAECRARVAEARSFRDEAFGLIQSLDQAVEPPLMVAESAASYAAAPARLDPTNRPTPPETSADGPKPAGGVVRPLRPQMPAWVRPVAWAATIVLAVGLGYSLQLPSRDLDPAPTELAAGDATGSARSATAEPPPTAALADEAGKPETRRASKTESADAESQPPAAAPRPLASERRVAAAPSAIAPVDTGLPAPPPDASNERRQAAAPAAPKKLADEAPTAGSELRASREREGRVDQKAAPQDSLSRRLGAVQLRLEEVVSSNATPAPAARLGATASARELPIAADSAIRLLGGSIKLVDGLTPERYGAVDSLVRVWYRTPWGPLLLEQWRDDDRLRHRLVAPVRAPADSTGAWTERIR